MKFEILKIKTLSEYQRINTKGAQAMHMAALSWHFKMPLLPGINRFHNP